MKTLKPGLTSGLPSNVRWDDLRLALAVAQAGSLSGAGEQLGINHSTALRAINRLEKALQVRLFIRHQRGYRLTDAGHLLRAQLDPIANNLERLCSVLTTLNSANDGVLRISTVADFPQLFTPLLLGFRQRHPQIQLDMIATDNRVNLSDGAVHAAIRFGPQPVEPDLIARQLQSVAIELYVAPEYRQRYGLPTTLEAISDHWWVLPSGEKFKIPMIQTLRELVPPQRIAFQSNSFTDISMAVAAGMGIGPLNLAPRLVEPDASLVRVPLGLPPSRSPMWLVYHRDLRQSRRLQAFIDYLGDVLDPFDQGP